MDLEIERLLDKLEEEIRIGKKTVFSGGRTSIDDIKCLSIIGQIRSALPTAITEARVVIQDRNNIIEQANLRANDIVSKAQRDANAMISESNIIAQAQHEADRIVGMARQEADAIRNESYASIYDLFNNAERELRRSVEMVASSKNELSAAMNSRRR